jgi:SNF2 family DNA or RNA helicase
VNIIIEISQKYLILENMQYEQIDRRLKTSLKRLNYISENTNVLIPYTQLNKEVMLSEIIRLLQKFTIYYTLSDYVKEDLKSFANESENFKIFSNKAKDIRNNKFEENTELVEDFKKFKKILEKNMTRKLYDFQFLSSFHLAFAQNACNFAVPGAGKTSIVYGAYSYLKSLPYENQKHVDKIMVIGPLSSFAPWEKEYKKCFGIEPISQRMSGVSIDERKQHLYSGNPAELTIISHAGVSNLETEIKDFLKNNNVMLVVDEAHRIKNPDGVWANSILEISKEAKARVILTGTPLPNGYEDLFNLYKFIYPFKYKEILNMHISNLEDMSKNDSIESDRVKKFIDNISPYFIRIKKSDLNLPKVHENLIHVDMDNHQRKIYDFIETKYIKAFEQNSSATAKDVLNKAKLIRLRQASINPSLLMKPLRDTLEINDSFWDRDPSANYINYDEFPDDSEIVKMIYHFEKIAIPSKFEATRELLQDDIFKRDEKAIIWTIFIQNAKELQKYLISKGIKSKLLIGEVPQEEREIIIDKFNNPNNDEFNVVIANPFSVSESISLHEGCRNAIYIERDYNCAMFLQSKDRIHRVGLKENQETNYYYLVSKDSIDSIIDKRLNLKAERMSKVIDEDIPLFTRINDSDETDIIKALLDDYAKRS